MCDTVTDELLEFNVNRWLAIDEEDGQICREIPVHKTGDISKPGK